MLLYVSVCVCVLACVCTSDTEMLEATVIDKKKKRKSDEVPVLIEFTVQLEMDTTMCI